jgi:predicted regulator of Ras-like GTPase activity (Roadblock/LC7/MglB family)
VTPLTSAFNSGELPALAIGADGLPVIAFRDNSAGSAVKVAKCANAACSGASAIATLDTNSTIFADISMTIGADGLPVVSYHDNSIFRQKVVKCANAFCSPFFRRR